MSPSLRYRSFCLGILVTTITWIIILYLYINLNSNNSNLLATGESIAIAKDSLWKQGLNSLDRRRLELHKNIPIENKKESLKDWEFSKSMKINYSKKKKKIPSNNAIIEDYDQMNQINAIPDSRRDNNDYKKIMNPIQHSAPPLRPPRVTTLTLDDLGLVRSDKDQLIRNEGYRLHVFNLLVSNRIGNHREIPDTRNALCKDKAYNQNLPTASIIICFYNEAKSTLLRTVHSIVDRTPPKLLYEIILVDDSSSLSDLTALDEDLKTLSAKILIYHTGSREGLIRARMFGAQKALGEVLVFLDSHCEVNEKWLEPLLERISENRSNVVCPIIDIINADTFVYSPSPLVRGGFNWGLHFKWDSVPRTFSKSEDYIKPIKTPTMAGGLFAINREYFNEMGEYDHGMDIWGGENLEISFRIWMCGGNLEIIPCSRVGHIFRKRRPYGSPSGQDTMLHNSLRVAHVWMDNYKEHFFETRPDARSHTYGNITERLKLRENLKCQSFDWYLKNIYPEVKMPAPSEKKKNPLTSKNNINKKLHFRKKNQHYTAQYMIRLTNSKLCLESEDDPTTKGSLLILRQCRKTKSQMWFETDKHELLLAEFLCLDASDDRPRLAKCHSMGGTQEWKHNEDSNTALYNLAAGMCLGVRNQQEGDYAKLEICTKPQLSKWDIVDGINNKL